MWVSVGPASQKSPRAISDITLVAYDPDERQFVLIDADDPCDAGRCCLLPPMDGAGPNRGLTASATPSYCASKMFRNFESALHDRLVDDCLRSDIRESAPLPRLHLLPHRLEVALRL